MACLFALIRCASAADSLTLLAYWDFPPVTFHILNPSKLAYYSFFSYHSYFYSGDESNPYQLKDPTSDSPSAAELGSTISQNDAAMAS